VAATAAAIVIANTKSNSNGLLLYLAIVVLHDGNADRNFF